MKHIYKKFNSLGEFSNYLNNGKVQPVFVNHEQSSTESTSRTRACQTTTYQEADNLLLYGDKKLQKKIEEAGVCTTRLKLKSMQSKRQIYSAVCGVAPNVPNAIAGIPTSMINVREIRQKQKVLNICYSCSCSGGVSAQTIIETAAQFISACMLIEASGIRTNIYLSEISQDGQTTAAFLVRIKSASQPFDVLKMCYPLAHPSMLRRHFFKAMEVTEGVPDSFVDSYGWAVENKDTMQKALGQDAKQMNYICGFYDCEGRTAEDIAKKIVGGDK